ncbi:hypothetical protein D3C86_1334030 [compost metagenome]
MPSWIQRAVGSSNGSPARNSSRRLDRSWRRSSAGSCFLSTRIAVGALNMMFTPYCATICQRMPPSGRIGVPSYMTVAMPASSGA